MGDRQDPAVVVVNPDDDDDSCSGTYLAAAHVSDY